MPAKNAVKAYFENGFYHIYNRGVEKRDIFREREDFVVFLSLLKKYLSPPPEDEIKIKEILKPSNLFKEIQLLLYCLMPNHFHLLLKQEKLKSMARLLQKICTSYAIYFNNKYQRVGPLFQGVYKAVVVDDENYLLYLSRYIHRNPLEILKVSPFQGETLQNYEWSSYPDYLGLRKTKWLNTDVILSIFNSNREINQFFKDIKDYKFFIEEATYEQIPFYEKRLILEEEPEPQEPQGETFER